MNVNFNQDVENFSFANTDDEAAAKYEEFKLKDPFPVIPPALLSFEDIKRYVAATGMIHPFSLDKPHIKQASYAVKLLGRCHATGNVRISGNVKISGNAHLDGEFRIDGDGDY